MWKEPSLKWKIAANSACRLRVQKQCDIVPGIRGLLHGGALWQLSFGLSLRGPFLANLQGSGL